MQQFRWTTLFDNREEMINSFMADLGFSEWLYGYYVADNGDIINTKSKEIIGNIYTSEEFTCSTKYGDKTYKFLENLM